MSTNYKKQKHRGKHIEIKKNSNKKHNKHNNHHKHNNPKKNFNKTNKTNKHKHPIHKPHYKKAKIHNNSRNKFDIRKNLFKNNNGSSINSNTFIRKKKLNTRTQNIRMIKLKQHEKLKLLRQQRKSNKLRQQKQNKINKQKILALLGNKNSKSSKNINKQTNKKHKHKLQKHKQVKLNYKRISKHVSKIKKSSTYKGNKHDSQKKLKKHSSNTKLKKHRKVNKKHKKPIKPLPKMLSLSKIQTTFALTKMFYFTNIYFTQPFGKLIYYNQRNKSLKYCSYLDSITQCESDVNIPVKIDINAHMTYYDENFDKC